MGMLRGGAGLAERRNEGGHPGGFLQAVRIKKGNAGGSDPQKRRRAGLKKL